MRSRIALVIAAGLALTPAVRGQIAVGADLSPEQVRASVLSAMDRGADPCDDFYRFACGGWVDSTRLPADEGTWTRSFSAVIASNRAALREIMQRAAAASAPPNSDAQRVGDLFASCMAATGGSADDLAPLRPLLASVDEARTPDDFLRLASELSFDGVEVFFRTRVVPDLRDPGHYLLDLAPGGLGMPDRDDYLSDDAHPRALLAGYREHVAGMLRQAGRGAETASREADSVVALETALARASLPRAQMRDREALYNRIDRAGLERLAPHLSWSACLAALGAPEPGAITVTVPAYFETLDQLLTSTPVETLRAYVRGSILDQAADFLPEPIAAAHHDFFDRAVAGKSEIDPRWKRCVDTTNRLLGTQVGRLYVESEFSGPSKELAGEIIADVESAFEQGLGALAWMDETTRARAIEKARKMTFKIGYPDTYPDDSGLRIPRGDYFAATRAALRFARARDIGRVGKAVDRSEWQMNPQRVDAYYRATSNEIGFPAAVLQPPFFHKDYPAALNYGAIGSGIGHDFTHAFDDQGRKFDGDGVLRSWWEPEAAARFESAARCVEEQYGGLEAAPGIRVDGKLTLGENIADIGGVRAAFRAYQIRKARLGATAPLIPGLSDEQLFFVGYAQLWCTLDSEESLRRQVTTDPHSPGRIRAFAPLRNVPAFRAAFACEPGDRMAPTQTCTVW